MKKREGESKWKKNGKREKEASFWGRKEHLNTWLVGVSRVSGISILQKLHYVCNRKSRYLAQESTRDLVRRSVQLQLAIHGWQFKRVIVFFDDIYASFQLTIYRSCISCPATHPLLSQESKTLLGALFGILLELDWNDYKQAWCCWNQISPEAMIYQETAFSLPHCFLPLVPRDSQFFVSVAFLHTKICRDFTILR